MWPSQSVELFPYLIARVSARAPSLLRQLCLREAAGALDRVADAAEQLRQWAGALEEAVYHLIPELTERDLRRAALTLKRDIHNLRPPSITAGQAQALRALLPQAAAARLRQWCEGADDRERWLTAARSLLQSELIAAGQALAGALEDPLLRRGLAMASPDFAASVLRGRDHEHRPGSRFARSCLSYLVRATAKTSPLTVFTRIGCALFDQETVPDPDHTPGCIHVNRAVASTLLWGCAQHPDLAGAFRYTCNPSVRTEGGPSQIVLPEYAYQGGVYGRVDRVVTAGDRSVHVETASRIRNSTYEECLMAVGTDDPHSLFSRLLQLHLIRPIAPWVRNAANPLRDLARALAAAGSDLAQRVAGHVLDAADAADDLAEAEAGERLRQIERIRGNSRTVLHIAGPLVPHWLEDGPVVYEDAAVPHAMPALGPLVRQDLDRVAGWMRRHIIRSHLYDKIVQCFVERFGERGTCDNPLEFLAGILTGEDSWRLVPQSLRADVKSSTVPGHPRTELRTGRGSAPPTASVYFQIAARSLEDVNQGNYLLVVNHCGPGHVGTLLRSARVLPLGAGLDEAIHRWLEGMALGDRLLQLPVYTEWNTLQYRTLAGLDVLEWPTEGPTEEPDPAWVLHNLRLVHNPADQTLDLLGPDGSPVCPQYLGLVPKHMVLGPLCLLLTLADPWFNGALGSRLAAWTGQVSEPSQVEFFPREAEGRVVYRRAHWRVPVREFPCQGAGEDDFGFFARVHAWRRQHRIPEEVYFSTERRSLPLDANQRKPMWLRFDSLHALQTVRPMLLGDIVAVRLEESLPPIADCWLAGEDGLPRASEFFAMFRWPSP